MSLPSLLAASNDMRKILLPRELLHVKRLQLEILESRVVTATVDCWESCQRCSVFGALVITDEQKVLVVKVVDISIHSHV